MDTLSLDIKCFTTVNLLIFTAKRRIFLINNTFHYYCCQLDAMRLWGVVLLLSKANCSSERIVNRMTSGVWVKLSSKNLLLSGVVYIFDNSLKAKIQANSIKVMWNVYRKRVWKCNPHLLYSIFNLVCSLPLPFHLKNTRTIKKTHVYK